MSAPTVRMVEWFNDHWYKLELLSATSQPETRWIPSVTTKLGITDKPFLARWRGDIGNREADMRLFEAQEKGKRIHNAWHIFCIGGVVLYNPWNRPNYTTEEISEIQFEYAGNVAVIQHQEEMLALVKLQRLVGILKPKMIFSEKVVYSLTHNDAGTADNAWEIAEGEYPINGAKPLFIKGGRYLVDLKTGSTVGESAFEQTAAYIKCDEEMGALPYQGSMILHTAAKTRTAIEGLACIVRSREDVEKDYLTYRLKSELWERTNEDAAPRVFEFPSLIRLQENNNGQRPKDVREGQSEVPQN